jgi:hypothetical protein
MGAHLLLLFSVLSLARPSSSAQTCAAADVERRDYNGFTLWHSCSKRAAIMFHYVSLLLRCAAPRHATRCVPVPAVPCANPPPPPPP